MSVRTHTLDRGNEREPMSPERLAKARARYWSNPEKYRAISLKSYYKNLDKNRAAARAREAAKKRRAASAELPPF